MSPKKFRKKPVVIEAMAFEATYEALDESSGSGSES